MADLDSQPKTIQSLYSWYNDGKLFVNRRYQRKLVWTLEEKQRLVESLLKRYPIPAILIAEKGDGNYEIIDGLQRLHTIMSYIENYFPDLGGRYFDVSKFPTASERGSSGAFDAKKGVSVIGTREVTDLLDYTVAMSVMRGASDDEIDDVFARINTYGHRLSDQERRQAGVQDDFSELVRNIGCTLRGDASVDVLPLSGMPTISIDLPKSKHGYEVRAEEVFWVYHGILRSTDLRDSMDEQCIADIVACVVGAELIERSRTALDLIYQDGSSENGRIATALDVHGTDRLQDEIKYCIDQVLGIAQVDNSDRLKNILFSRPTNNGFPALFATLVIGFYESLVRGKKKIADIKGARSALTRIDARIDTGRGSVTVQERRKNINVVRSLLEDYLADDDLVAVYRNQTVADIDAIIRRSSIELPEYELKQGMLRLDDKRSVDNDMPSKIVNTICAIANNGPTVGGTLIIGVTDSESDCSRIENLDKISARKVAARRVVGVAREAAVLQESVEEYFSRWKHIIENSELSEPLKGAVLASISYHDYYGLGVIIVSIPPQSEVSYVGDDLYFRSGDETRVAVGAKEITAVASRF